MNETVKELNNLNIEMLNAWVKEFHSYYKYDSSFNTQTKHRYALGNKVQQRCRYCGMDKSQSTFKKNAHIIPKVIGNRLVTCHYECDRCNAIFGKYETDLSSFIGLRGYYETTDNYGIKKRRVYKSKSGEGTIYFSERGMELIDPKSEIFELLENGKTFKSIVNKNPYIPLNVFKALIKISLSVLKDESMKDFDDTIKFLITDKFDNHILIKKFAKLSYLTLIDFYIEHPIIYIFRKLPSLKEYEIKENIHIPNKTVLIFFRDFIYQIFIPFDISDDISLNNENKSIIFPLYPPMIASPKCMEAKLYHNYYHELRDLSSNKKIRNEMDEFFWTFPDKPIATEYSKEEHLKIKNKYNLRDK